MPSKNRSIKTNLSKFPEKVHPMLKWIVSLINEYLQQYYLGAFVIVLLFIVFMGDIVSNDGLIVLAIIVGFGLLHLFAKWLDKD